MSGWMGNDAGGGTAGLTSTSVCEVEAFTLQQESPVKRHAVVKSLLSLHSIDSVSACSSSQQVPDAPDAPAVRPDPTRAAPLSFVATPKKKKAISSSAARSDVEHTMIESFDMSMCGSSPVRNRKVIAAPAKESPVKSRGTVKSLISLHSIDSVSSAAAAAAVLECLDIEDFDDDYLSPATSKPAAAAALKKENSNHALNTKSGGGGGAPDFRAQVVAFYTTHNPSKLGHVDEILATYAGREAALMSTLEATYTASSSSASGRSPLAPVQTTAQAAENSQQPQAAHTCNTGGGTRAKSWQGTHQDPAVKGRKKSLITRMWRKTKKTVGR